MLRTIYLPISTHLCNNFDFQYFALHTYVSIYLPTFNY